MRLSRGDREGALEALRAVGGADFSDYRAELIDCTFEEHFGRSGCSDGPAWVARLRRGGRDLGELTNALTVRVTSFFRDAGTFADLERVVVPDLLRGVGSGSSLRTWVIGCATGEEVWSLAMILDATCGAVPWEILATDIDWGALALAERAVYPDVEAVPQRFAERYFLPDGRFFSVCREIRQRVRFVEHRFMDPQLAPVEAIVPSFELVSCRNVLLHFSDRLREAAWTRLASVVRPEGALMMGSVEMPPSGAPFTRFMGVEGRSPLFRRRGRG